jgi:hypothetical protein
MPDTPTINILVKPYVKRYLINNCGNPADLSKLPKVQSLFKRLLRKPLFRFESLKIPDHACYVSIQISNDTFSRYGWEMTRTGMMQFNSEIEAMIKFIMRTYITHRAALGYTVAKCVRDFQTWFDMPEDVWSWDAIYKDLYRHTDITKDREIESFLKQMDKKLNKLFVENLSALGTISKQYKHELSKI